MGEAPRWVTLQSNMNGLWTVVDNAGASEEECATLEAAFILRDFARNLANGVLGHAIPAQEKLKRCKLEWKEKAS